MAPAHMASTKILGASAQRSARLSLQCDRDQRGTRLPARLPSKIRYVVVQAEDDSQWVHTKALVRGVSEAFDNALCRKEGNGEISVDVAIQQVGSCYFHCRS